MSESKPPSRYSITVDTWTALSHKRALNKNISRGRAFKAPDWVGDHARRMAAYYVLNLYLRNAVREQLPITDEFERLEHREYGDAKALRNAAHGALMGLDQSITVEHADDDLPDIPDETAPDPENEPTSPPEPAPDDRPKPDELTPEERTKRQEKRAEIERARARQEELEEWADRELFRREAFAVERDAVGLGDGVYRFTASSEYERVCVERISPECYFPVLPLTDPSAKRFPRKIHFAWEYELADVRYVHRITYHVRPIGITYRENMDGEEEEFYPADASYDEELGRFTRSYPYQDEGEKPSPYACYMTSASYPLEDAKGTVYDLDARTAIYDRNDEGEQMRDLDLMIDFIPVVHVPNTVPEDEHYGDSIVMSVSQLLDDVQLADSDLAKTSEIVGTPPVAVAGAGTSDEGVTTYGPNQLFKLPKEGSISVVDVSNSMAPMMARVEALLDRLSANSRVQAALLGRVNPADVASGLLLAFSFGPLGQLVGEMRLVREEKNPLLFKIVQRLSIVHGWMKGPVLPANYEYGSFLPHDRQQVVRDVIEALKAKAISRRTAVRKLVEEGGFDNIDDVLDELSAIEHEDFEGASLLLDALGDENAVAEYLGLPAPPPRPEPPPTPPIPGVPAPGPEPTPPGPPQPTQ